MTQRIIIHAGFAKCGSTGIQSALLQNFAKLQRDGFFLFGKELRIVRAPEDFEVPVWALERAKEKKENLPQKLSDGIRSVTEPSSDHVGILSAENLANAQMASLFRGLDDQFNVSVIFYVRPQLQWIPSAWKQWGLKSGMSLADFVSRCIKTGRPWFKSSIEAWREALPLARLHVRFLIPELLTGADPARDFFHLLGLPPERYDIGTQLVNPSLDFSILHVLSKNPQLFSGVHDNSLMRSLSRLVPEKFRSTNIQMLSGDEEARVEERFRDENLWLLNTYCNGIDVDHIYRTYFTPRNAKVTYSSMAEMDLIYRCLGIVLESIADQESKLEVSSPAQISAPPAVNAAKRFQRRIKHWLLGKNAAVK